MMNANIYVKNDGNTVAVELPFGTYKVDFIRKSVEFQKTPLYMYSPDIIWEKGVIDAGLKPKEGFEGVMHTFDRADIKTYEYTIDIEYLDLTNGNIPEHSHPGNSQEVYLAVEEPYCGEICLAGERHKPFAKKQLAVKINRKGNDVAG